VTWYLLDLQIVGEGSSVMRCLSPQAGCGKCRANRSSALLLSELR
jgi:hypothetical protein